MSNGTQPNAQSASLRAGLQGAIANVLARELAPVWAVGADTIGRIIDSILAEYDRLPADSPPVAGLAELERIVDLTDHSPDAGVQEAHDIATELWERSRVAGERDRRNIIADAIDDGINAETPEEREAAIANALRRLRAAPTSGEQETRALIADQLREASDMLRGWAEAGILTRDMTTDTICMYERLAENCYEAAHIIGGPEPTSGPVEPSEERLLKCHFWCGCRRFARWERCPRHSALDHDEDPPSQREQRTLDVLARFCNATTTDFPFYSCNRSPGHEGDHENNGHVWARAERVSAETGERDAIDARVVMGSEAYDELNRTIRESRYNAPAVTPAPVAGDTDIQNPTVRGERPDTGNGLCRACGEPQDDESVRRSGDDLCTPCVVRRARFAAGERSDCTAVTEGWPDDDTPKQCQLTEGHPGAHLWRYKDGGSFTWGGAGERPETLADRLEAVGVREEDSRGSHSLEQQRAPRAIITGETESARLKTPTADPVKRTETLALIEWLEGRATLAGSEGKHGDAFLLRESATALRTQPVDVGALRFAWDKEWMHGTEVICDRCGLGWTGPVAGGRARFETCPACLRAEIAALRTAPPADRLACLFVEFGHAESQWQVMDDEANYPRPDPVAFAAAALRTAPSGRAPDARFEARDRLVRIAISLADPAPWRQTPDWDVLKSVVADYRQAWAHAYRSTALESE